MTVAGPDTAGAALLRFSIGPVQPFIAAAQSVRDLWAGSYTLAWLVVHALRPVVDRHGPAAVVFPRIEHNPLMSRLRTGQQTGGAREADGLLTPCLPNLFLALAPESDAEELAATCSAECRLAWHALYEAVHKKLDRELRPLCQDWDRDWRAQVDSFFEIRTGVLRFKDIRTEDIRRLCGPNHVERAEWGHYRELSARLLEAHRMVRHVPDYRARPDARGYFPQKCTLLGTYEQVGPGERHASREFWQAVAKKTIEGTKVRPGERLCAVSLVKRFAWTTARRFPDTATIAAACWLNEQPQILNWRDQHPWSGQWLHWRRPDEGVNDGEEPVPADIRERIGQKIRAMPTKPPAYYAVLMMDGDRMGARLRTADRAREHAISAALSQFALETVPAIVKSHLGELVYAGGDDVLALLPTEKALSCARALAAAFSELGELALPSDIPTMSGGLVIVHYKEDLRFALEQAREAEKSAKARGRKALELRVCRRSGEHTSARLPWASVPEFEHLVALFVGGSEANGSDAPGPARDPVARDAEPASLAALRRGLSDRWAYKLQQHAPTLAALPDEAIRAELRHLVARVERGEALRRWAEPAFAAYCTSRCGGVRSGAGSGQFLGDFSTLCQSASFLARGRDR